MGEQIDRFAGEPDLVILRLLHLEAQRAMARRRNSAVILFQAGMPDVAVALLCQDSEIREAFREAGKPCPADRPKPAVAEAEQPAAAPQPAAATIPQEPPPPMDTRPAWCAAPIRTEADRATYNYYCTTQTSAR